MRHYSRGLLRGLLVDSWWASLMVLVQARVSAVVRRANGSCRHPNQRAQFF